MEKQKIEVFKNPFPYMTVENMYNEEELNLIWEELNFLTDPIKLSQNDTGTDKDLETKNMKSESKSIVLDYTYINRNISNILNVNRKLFDGGYLHTFSQISQYCKSVSMQNSDFTKIRYYENGIDYSPHIDLYNYTAITFFYKAPKAFDGGNLFFPEHDIVFECKNNAMILFPSYITHAAKKVIMDENDYYSGRGKYSMMQFLKQT